ncbi:hypothetical protein JCM18382A_11440 [Bradyrhizobium sp. 17-4]
MVCAVMISTLAGVCSGVRLRRLPVPPCVVALSVGEAAPDAPDAAARGAPPAAAAVAGLARCRAVAVLLLRAAGLGFADADGATSIGSSVVGGAVCAEASAGSNNDDKEQTRPRRQLRATEEDEDMKRLAVTWHVTANADWRIAGKAVLRSHQDAPARCARV